jgi:hypothetical protein
MAMRPNRDDNSPHSRPECAQTETIRRCCVIDGALKGMHTSRG